MLRFQQNLVLTLILNLQSAQSFGYVFCGSKPHTFQKCLNEIFNRPDLLITFSQVLKSTW